MRLGMFMQPVHDPARNLTKVLEDDRETVKLADQLGYHEVWVGEHTAATSEPITDPLVFLATLIGETENIKLGTGVYCLPHHHPAQIAGQAALFDHLSKGRFQMGVGNGSLSSDVELFEVGGDTDRGAMVCESIEHILGIWAGDPPYDRGGEFWNVKIANVDRIEYGVGAFIKPYQQPHPPIAIPSCRPSPAARGSRVSLAGSRFREQHFFIRAIRLVIGRLTAKAPRKPAATQIRIYGGYRAVLSSLRQTLKPVTM